LATDEGVTAPKDSKEPETWYLAYRECPAHHWNSISFESEEHGGQRLTASKCCGRWDLVKRFAVDPAQVAADIIGSVWDGSTQVERFALEDRMRAIIAEHPPAPKDSEEPR
jgi:hypothetical protein